MFELIRPHRRRGARRVYRAACQAVRMDDLRQVGERILDLSTRGMLLACDERMEVGQEVLVSFRAPWLGPAMLVLGEVSRVVEGWRLGDPGYCAALRFLETDAEDRRELAERLAHLPPVPPSRRYPNDYAQTVRAISMGCC